MADSIDRFEGSFTFHEIVEDGFAPRVMTDQVKWSVQQLLSIRTRT